MKSYVELECNNLEVISHKMMSIVQPLIDQGLRDWVFLNSKEVLSQIPELGDFFKQYKLYLRDASVTILYDDLETHIDTLPVVAKINFPISNTDGWANRWYHVDEQDLASCPTVVDHLGFSKENIPSLSPDKITLIDELMDHPKPIVFNSRIVHSVNKIQAKNFPRVVASFTFFNQPIHLLQ